MDTSELYIDMCRKAVEIQKDHQWSHGDYTETNIIVTAPFLQNWKIEGLVWLPRQDQLQEMVKINYAELPAHLIKRLDNFCKYFILDYVPMSLEQLLLSFVMASNFNKIWNGDDWVEVGK